MAIMPGVSYRSIDYAGVPTMLRYDVVCIHTIVGHDPAPAAHFSTGADGLITQSRDTVYQSAANLSGNYRVIAIENEDFGPEYGTWNTSDGHDIPAFTAAQCEAIARVCAWAHQAHGIPLVLCPDSRPTSRGIGYHRQGIDGNWESYAYGGRVDGGEVWTRSPGKTCPGDRRIEQIITVIIPRARVLAGLEENDMLTPDEHNDLKYIAAMMFAFEEGYDEVPRGPYPNTGPIQLARTVGGTADRVVGIESNLEALAAKVDRISTAGIDYAQLAKAINDDADARGRDGNPATGPVT